MANLTMRTPLYRPLEDQGVMAELRHMETYLSGLSQELAHSQEQLQATLQAMQQKITALEKQVSTMKTTSAS